MYSVRDKGLGRKKLIEKKSNLHILLLFLWPFSLLDASYYFPNLALMTRKMTQTKFCTNPQKNTSPILRGETGANPRHLKIPVELQQALLMLSEIDGQCDCQYEASYD